MQLDIVLGHKFVKEVLDIVLQPTKGADIPYSSKTLQFLLERKTVSTSMVEGGLLHALMLRNDWVNPHRVFLSFTVLIILSSNRFHTALALYRIYLRPKL